MVGHWSTEVAERGPAVPPDAEKLSALMRGSGNKRVTGFTALVAAASLTPNDRLGGLSPIVRLLELPDLQATLANTPPEVRTVAVAVPLYPRALHVLFVLGDF